VGIVAGFILHVLLSVVVVQGQGTTTAPAKRECKKSAPARDSAAPQRPAPIVSMRS
jgi:hypothetical protein